MEIILTQGQIAIVDDEDYDTIKGFKWCALKRENNSFHVIARIPKSGRPGVNILMHQLLTGFPETDHINGNGLDNRRINLRSATRAQNMRNARLRKDNTSGFKGVARKRKRWMASLHLDSVQYHLGVFDTPEEASTAYGLCALAAYSEFARLE